MLKDSIIFETQASEPEEIDFVEEMWSAKLIASLHSASDDDLSTRDEFSIIDPYLQRLPKDALILDGGCGRGEWVRLLSNHGFQTTGVDISKELIAALNTAFPEQKYFRGDIRETMFQDNHFDMYLSWGAFEHFEIGLAPCLMEAYRILKPDGLLFFSVPFANKRQTKKHESVLIKKFLDEQPGQNPPNHLQFYQWRLTVGEVAREIRRVGFTPIQIIPIHKDEGLRRLLRYDFGINLSPGSMTEMLLLRILRQIIPAEYVSHMLLSVARKQ